MRHYMVEAASFPQLGRKTKNHIRIKKAILTQSDKFTLTSICHVRTVGTLRSLNISNWSRNWRRRKHSDTTGTVRMKAISPIHLCDSPSREVRIETWYADDAMAHPESLQFVYMVNHLLSIMIGMLIVGRVLKAENLLIDVRKISAEMWINEWCM